MYNLLFETSNFYHSRCIIFNSVYKKIVHEISLSRVCKINLQQILISRHRIITNRDILAFLETSILREDRILHYLRNQKTQSCNIFAKCSKLIRFMIWFKGTLMQIWKSASIFVFIWKYVEDFTLKLFKICIREIGEKFINKHSETIEYVRN